MFAMVDCNNFYVSCERLFQPNLNNRPVIVLSNNDGCVVSRSQEAKQLGVQMAVPLFKVKRLIQQYDIQVCSSNYALYADLSARVMLCLEELAEEVEIYSIDEAFLNLSDLPSSTDLSAYGNTIAKRIYQWVGLPVCVGIAPTKTLAKLANYGAKKYPATGGVVDLTSTERQHKLMSITPVNEVWGVGRRLTELLNKQGIDTALDLINAPTRQLREQTSVLLERTIMELRGTSCLEFGIAPNPKKTIINSRSFGQPVIALDQLVLSAVNHATNAAIKLRKQEHCAVSVSVFLRTNGFAKTDKQYKASATYNFDQATDNSLQIVSACVALVKQLWRENYRYKKLGVVLHGLVDKRNVQISLFTSRDIEADDRLMKVMDNVNNRYANALRIGSGVETGNEQAWRMNRGALSPAYTTKWSDLPRAN